MRLQRKICQNIQVFVSAEKMESSKFILTLINPHFVQSFELKVERALLRISNPLLPRRLLNYENKS